MHFQLVLHLYLNWFYPFIKSGILSHVYSTDVFPCLQCTRHQTYWPSSLDSPELHCTCILVAFDRNRWKLFIMTSLIRKYMLWEGFYHDFSTKKASASGGFAPWPPPRGSAPWTPEVTSPPLTIYPGAAPESSNYLKISDAYLLQRPHKLG